MNGIKVPGSKLSIADVQKMDKPLPATKDAKGAAEQFEALLLQEMLKSMWSTVPKDGVISASFEEGMYRDMLNEALATSISEGQGIGIKDVIFKDLDKLEKKK